MIQLGLLGASGRMGKQVEKLLQTEFSKDAKLIAAPKRGESMDALLSCDAVIDFALPEAVTAFAKIAAPAGTKLPALIVGSTGWKLDTKKELEELSKKTPILMSSNFSIGVLALTEILRSAAPLLDRLGYQPVIVDTHHKHKKDSPSGTALSLQRAIAPAGPGNVQTHSIRQGEVIGDHEVTFYGTADHLTFGHFAQDRSIFARGAIQCALWLASQRGSLTGFIGTENYFKFLKEQLQ